MNIDEVLDKIRKLRALSTSANENEAALAAAKAAELIARFQVEEAQLSALSGEDEPVKGDIPLVHTGSSNWRRILADGISDSCGVRAYCHGSNMYAIGRQSDVRAAGYLYGLVAADIERLSDSGWRAVLIEWNGHPFEQPRRWKNAFRLGAAVVVRHRLQEGQQAVRSDIESNPDNSQALVVIRKREDEIARLAKMHGLKDAGGRKIQVRSRGYASGQAAGARVNLGRGKAAGALGGAPGLIGVKR